MTDNFDKIIFISMDDTSTSPMAQAICRGLIADETVEVISRGLIVHFSEPVNPKAIDILKNNNVKNIKESSEQFEVEELTDKSLVLAMSQKEKSLLAEDFGVDGDNVFILSEYVEEFGEITDPYGENIVGYERSYFELVRMVKKLVYKLC